MLIPATSKNLNTLPASFFLGTLKEIYFGYYASLYDRFYHFTRPLQCSRCSLRYKNKDALVAHEKTHDNAQYACEFCSIAFKRKDNLKRHIKSKHSTMSMIDKLMLNHSEQVNTDNHQLLIPHPTH